MPFLRTFNDFAPPSRGDSIPFARADIYENYVNDFATANMIDSLVLDPLDVNPSKPMSRNLTAVNAMIAQFDNGFYWIVWADVNNVQFISDVIHALAPDLTDLEDLVRSEFPLTWDGLAGDNSLGLAMLRRRIQFTKASILPAAVAALDETTYSPTLTLYIAKCAAKDLIGPGMEYWMRQKISLSATGTNENKTYVDPVGALKELAKRLAGEIEMLKGNPEIVASLVSSGEAPAISNTGDAVTQDPFSWPLEFTPYANPGVAQQ